MADIAELKAYAEEQANAYGIPPQIFLNLISAESSWNPFAVSGAGAQGIAQLEPSTAPNINRFDPFESLKFAAQLLSGYYKKFGNWGLALAAYNAGPGAVESHGGIPPYPETQDYVKKILGGTSANATSTNVSGTEAKGVKVQSLKILFWAAVAIVGLIVLKGVSGHG